MIEDENIKYIEKAGSIYEVQSSDSESDEMKKLVDTYKTKEMIQLNNYLAKAIDNRLMENLRCFMDDGRVDMIKITPIFDSIYQHVRDDLVNCEMYDWNKSTTNQLQSRISTFMQSTSVLEQKIKGRKKGRGKTH